MTTLQDEERRRSAHIRALLREREEATSRGETDRVALIDELLRAFGFLAAPPHKRAEERVRS